MAQLEIYWSFRSPYSYLAIDRIVALAHDYEVGVDFRPVRPLAMREPYFFERGREQFLPYLFRDVPREAERLGLPFSLPNPDPIAMNMMTKEIASEQPIMVKVMGLAFAAISQGKGLEFALAVGHSIWEGTANWCDDEVLVKTIATTGLELEKLTSWTFKNEAVIAGQLARNETAQLVHHWGVPLMVLDGEPFFGQDRLESLIWRLECLGLRHS